MSKFFEALGNIFQVPDLRKRVLFTLAMLAVYRLGAAIPTPGIDANKLEAFFPQNQGGTCSASSTCLPAACSAG